MLLRVHKNKNLKNLVCSFDNLPETNHLDGKYRLRRYSVVKCNGSCVDTGNNTFVQSKEYNEFQGDMVRKFEPIEGHVINSNEMLEICSDFIYYCGLSGGSNIDVHQMRVVTSGDNDTQVSPEGVHQDGYDYICVVGISRHNIEGGNFLAYFNKDQEPFMSMPLDSGMVVMLNDKSLWHNASTIKSIDGFDGHLDSFILTAKI